MTILAQGFWMTLTLLFEMYFWKVVTLAAIAAASYYGGQLLMDAPQDAPGPGPNAQSRSWNPRTTQQVGISRPRCYGKNLHHGNVVAKWTGVSGSDREILYMVIEHGDGPTKGICYTDGNPDAWFEGQPAANFSGVTIQERVGTMNQTCMTGFEKLKLEDPIRTELLLSEPVIYTTHNDYFEDLEYTIMWPNGLRKYHKSGGMDYSACTVRVRIREYGTDTWTTIFNSNVTVRTTHPYFKFYKVSDLWSGIERGKQYELEFQNMTGPGERHVNDVYIKSVREVVDVPFTRPGKAIVGITALATEQLSGNIDVEIVREDRLVNVWNGTSWAIEYSRNRSWVTYDAFTQPVISGSGTGPDPWVIEYYEGISPEYMDLDFFYNWAEFCSTQVHDGYGGYEDRIACDTIIDFQTNVWDIANDIAQIGRAKLYWYGDTLTGYIDTIVPPAEITELVTMDNIMARTWKNAWVDADELAGKVEVLYNDSRRGYERTPCPLPNEYAGDYTKVVTIEGIGITTRGTALHTANFCLERNRLIRNTNEFRKHKDAFRYKLGQVVRVQHKTPNWGQAFRVVRKTANNKVKLDRHCAGAAGDLLWVRTYDAAGKQIRVDNYTVVSVANNILTIAETWLSPPRKDDSCAVGGTSDIQTRRIIKIDARADNYFDITVETYDTELFDADDRDPDNPDQNYIWTRPKQQLIQPMKPADLVDLINAAIPPQPDVDSPVTSNCTWTGSGGNTVAWSKTDATEPIIFRYKGVSYEITPDSTTDEFIYWDPAFTTTFRHTNDAAVAVTVGKWYMCRNLAGVAYPATPFAAVHAGVLQAGTITAAYGQIADAAIETAKIKDLAVETLKIKDNAVTVPASVYTAANISVGSAWLTVQTLAFTATAAPLVISFSLVGTPISGMRLECRLRRDSNVLVSFGPVALWPGTCQPVTFDFGETPGAGTYSYTVQCKESVSGNGFSVSNRVLHILETKK